MKYKQVGITGIILCMALLWAQVKSARSNDVLSPRQQVTEPAFYECGISISPEVPTIDDAVQVSVGGQWPDSCVPEYESHQMVGNEIRVDFKHDPIAICAPVVLPWGHTVDVGNLSKGIYEVTGYINNAACGSREFVVFEEVIPFYLPLVARH